MSLPDFLFIGYTTPAPGSFLQQGGGELSPRSGLQPPGGFSSIGAGTADPASGEKKKAAQQAYQEELKRQVMAKSNNWFISLHLTSLHQVEHKASRVCSAPGFFPCQLPVQGPTVAPRDH